jgi:hypothetical protein
MYWFQVPVILTNLGKVITVTDFNLFFALTLPINFLALVLIYWGSIEVLGSRLKPKSRKLLIGWFLFAVVFFVYHFIARKGVIEVYSLPIVGNFLLYVPLNSIIIITFVRWFSRSSVKTMNGVLGGTAIMGACVLGIVRNVMIIKNIFAYPPQFWYVVLTSAKAFFVLQTVSILLLVTGFFLLHRMYYRTQDHIS